MGECLAYGSLQGFVYKQTQTSSSQLVYKLSATCRQPTFVQVTQVNSCNSFAIDDSTVNIVQFTTTTTTTIIIINIIIIITRSLYLNCHDCATAFMIHFIHSAIIAMANLSLVN